MVLFREKDWQRLVQKAEAGFTVCWEDKKEQEKGERFSARGHSQTTLLH
jgi:hypothetical protein